MEVSRRMSEVVQETRESVHLPSWMRALAIIVGVISIGAGLVAFLFPLVAVETLALLFSIALFIIGVERLVVGISGRTYRVVTRRLETPVETPIERPTEKPTEKQVEAPMTS